MSTVFPVALTGQLMENRNFTIQSKQVVPEHCLQQICVLES